MKEREFPGTSSNFNSLHHQSPPSLQELQPQMLEPSNFDPQDDFLAQMLSSVPPSAAFPWADDHPSLNTVGNLDEQLASKMRQQQISNGAARALMLQQQLLVSRGLPGVDGQMLHGDQNDAVDAQSFNSANLANDTSVKAVFSDFSGFLGQTSNQPPHFLRPEGGSLHQSPNFVTPPMTQPATSGGGSAAGQPKQRVRARRGQATDPHSIAERLRRERIAERMKSLQELVPNANKTDKASMLDEIIDYVKFLQLQVKVLSMSRLGGGAAAGVGVTPLVANSSEGRGGNGTTSTSNNKVGMAAAAAEQQVAKLMEEDMGSAMQYLQGKGLCLMPISLATAISTSTSRNHPNNPLLSGEAAGGPSSPNMSALSVQSATQGVNGTGDIAVKDSKVMDRNGVD